MGDTTAISWAHHTFNPWEGCTRISPACDHCYAADRAHRFGKDHLWAGELRRTSRDNWRKPLRWNREAEAAGARRRVFCASLSDVFDNQAPQPWRDDLWRLIESTPNLIWMLLTKRPQNAAKMLPDRWAETPQANIWFGITGEDQERLEQRYWPAAAIQRRFGWLLFLSAEPLLGRIDPSRISVYVDQVHGGHPGGDNRYDACVTYTDALTGKLWGWDRTPAGELVNPQVDGYEPGFGLIIAGGESGAKARPSHRDWYRTLRDDCAAAGVPFHFKQWGEWLPEGQLDRNGYYWAPGQDDTVHWWKPEPAIGTPIEDGQCSIRVGIKQAGFWLDGRPHRAMPAIA